MTVAGRGCHWLRGVTTAGRGDDCWAEIWDLVTCVVGTALLGGSFLARVVAIWAGLKPAPTFRASLSKAKGRGNGVVCFSLDSRVRGDDGRLISLELE